MKYTVLDNVVYIDWSGKPAHRLDLSSGKHTVHLYFKKGHHLAKLKAGDTLKIG